MEELTSVTVTIGDRRYPLKVRKEDEALVHHAEQLINEKYNEFQLRFTGQEKIDFLAMSALMNCVDLLRRQTEDDKREQALIDRITEADRLANETLKG